MLGWSIEIVERWCWESIGCNNSLSWSSINLSTVYHDLNRYPNKWLSDSNPYPPHKFILILSKDRSCAARSRNMVILHKWRRRSPNDTRGLTRKTKPAVGTRRTFLRSMNYGQRLHLSFCVSFHKISQHHNHMYYIIRAKEDDRQSVGLGKKLGPH